MKLVASLIVRNELHRLLGPCVAHLLEFVDEVCVLDNGSSDGWQETLRPTWGDAGARVTVWTDPEADREHAESFFVNHARSRQLLLERTVEHGATHILAIDADEFVADGALLRKACEARRGALALCLQEVWNITPEGLEIRQDGGWEEHDVTLVWCPETTPAPHRIVDRGPATGRTPESLKLTPRGHACTALLHFGWTNRAEREDRHARYVVADGGRFHASSHLESILWPAERVQLRGREWPAALEPRRTEITRRAGWA